jgi:hypothetical protein
MRPLILAGAFALGLSTAGCAGMTLPGGGNSAVSDAVSKFLTDPNCGHTDELHVAIGPVSTGTMDLKRTCNGPAVAPAPVQAASAAP